jgi:hypothetical protein
MRNESRSTRTRGITSLPRKSSDKRSEQKKTKLSTRESDVVGRITEREFEREEDRIKTGE